MKPSAQSFVRFCTDVCGVDLTPAQRVLAAVTCDDVEPGDLEGDEREIARQLFGPVDTVPALARGVLCYVKGARVGGSRIFGALASLHAALTLPLPRTLAPGERAVALILAPDLRLARQTLRFATGAIEASKALRSRVLNEGDTCWTLRRENGAQVSIEALPAGRGGAPTRGRSFVSACLSEASFFLDADTGVVNDADVYRAIAPRIMKGGKLRIESTPWTEAGLVHTLYTDNFGSPTTALVARCPTVLMRPDMAELVARERARDPDNAAREFDCEFISGGSAQFFDGGAIDRCVDKDRPLDLDPGHAANVGADFGFRSDSSALAVVQWRDAAYQLAALEEVRPAKGSPLVPSIVVARFAGIARYYGCTTITADGHYAEAIREHLRANRVSLLPAPEGLDGKARTYLHLRSLIHAGQLQLPNHPRLIAQLKSIVAKPLPGGGLQITAPRKASGGHGDLVSALVLACWVQRQTRRAMPAGYCP